MDGGRIRLAAGNHLPLPLAGNIGIKQPRHSLPSILLFQILRLFAIGRNPRHKVLPLGPRLVTSLGCSLLPNLYYPRGESGHLHKKGGPLGMTSPSSPAGRGGRQTGTPARGSRCPGRASNALYRTRCLDCQVS